MQITIAIPNYNGKNLLEKNLPNIIASGADEILIIDDGSTDQSMEFLDRIRNQESRVKISGNGRNLGFIPTVNKLFTEAKGDVVVLLNNDVYAEKDFLKSLAVHFSDDKVFAVNCHEEGQGPAVAFWKDGFFAYKVGEEKNIVQKSAWASGGSAAYSKKIWQKIGGLDELFEPFYFEDTDISFRALQEGYKILWEPKSKVQHDHETTISKTVDKRYKNWVTERNLLLLIWKNIRAKKLLKEHKINLIKRLLNISKIGYWVPFIWALTKLPVQKVNKNRVLSDLEVINYAQK